MKLGILLFIAGAVLTIYFAKIKFQKRFLSKFGIVIGILFLVYGLILLIQPNDYIKYTKTTISKETSSSAP